MGRTICFTGRRPKDLCRYKQESYNEFVGDLAEFLYSFADLSGKEKLKLISGGAQGFDQLAFWASDLMKNWLSGPARDAVTNAVYVPFKGQQRVWVKEGLFGQDQYELMLAKADQVAYLREELSGKREVIDALMDRNHKMVDAADIVIALYPDDNWREADGGTAECMRYAAGKNKNVIQIKYQIENGILKGIFPAWTDQPPKETKRTNSRRTDNRDIPSISPAGPGNDGIDLNR